VRHIVVASPHDMHASDRRLARRRRGVDDAWTTRWMMAMMAVRVMTSASARGAEGLTPARGATVTARGMHAFPPCAPWCAPGVVTRTTTGAPERVGNMDVEVRDALVRARWAAELEDAVEAAKRAREWLGTGTGAGTARARDRDASWMWRLSNDARVRAYMAEGYGG
jgi:hypothetical protein